MENIITLIALNAIFAFFFVRGAVRSAVGYARLVLGVLALCGIAAVAVAVQRATGEDFSPVAAIAAFGVIASAMTLVVATVKFLTVAAAAAIGVAHGRKAMSLRSEMRCMSYAEQYSAYADNLRKEIARHEEIHDATFSWLYTE